jgi:hypothetical protein
VHDAPVSIIIDEPVVDARRKTTWARLIQKVYEVDPFECPNCGATMCIIAFIEDADIIERILRHLNVSDPLHDAISPAGSDPPRPAGEPCQSLVPGPGHRLSSDRTVTVGPAMADSILIWQSVHIGRPRNCSGQVIPDTLLRVFS